MKGLVSELNLDVNDNQVNELVGKEEKKDEEDGDKKEPEKKDDEKKE